MAEVNRAMFAGASHCSRDEAGSALVAWTGTDMGGRGGRPVNQGAASVIWGVLLPDDGPSGGFFRDGRPVPW
jgi:hypothetical protein